MKKKSLFGALISLFAFCCSSCYFVHYFSSDEEEEKASYNKIDVTMNKANFFVNETINYDNFNVKVEIDGQMKETSDFRILWEDDGKVISNNSTLNKVEGTYNWIFETTDGTSERFITTINLYKSDDEKIYISSYPKVTTYYDKNNLNLFSTEGLEITRDIKYTTANGKEQHAYYKLAPKDCTLNYVPRAGVVQSLKDGYKFEFDNDSKRYDVNITTNSILADKRIDLFCSYPIYLVSDTLSSNQPDNYINKNTSDVFETEDSVIVNIDNTSSNSSSDQNDNYISPENVDTSFGLNYYRHHNPNNHVTCPTTGDVPLLIIPIVFDNNNRSSNPYAYTPEKEELINKCFFGDDDDLYFESVQSFYYKSSFGNLNFTGKVAPAFNPRTIASNELSNVKIETDGSVNLTYSQVLFVLDEALSFLKLIGYDMREYDSDGDGFIDAIWLISFSKINEKYTYSSWGYTANIDNATADYSDPKPSVFSLCTIGMLEDEIYDYKVSSSSTQQGKNYEGDAHILIHETGHLLGLKDYYTTSSDYEYVIRDNTSSSNSNKKITYGPLGGLDVMDKDYLDHNPYSKIMLGWTKPYLVYGGTQIELKASLYENQCIVLPYNDIDYSNNKYKKNGKVVFNPYDEYIIIEYNTFNSKYDLDTYNNDNILLKGYDVYKALSFKDSNIDIDSGVRVYYANRHSIYYASDNSVKNITSDNYMDIFNSNNTNIFSPTSNTEAGPFSEVSSLTRLQIDSAVITNDLKFNNYDNEISIIPANSKYCVHSDTAISADQMKNILFKNNNYNTFMPYDYVENKTEILSRIGTNDSPPQNRYITFFDYDKNKIIKRYIRNLSDTSLEFLYNYILFLEFNGTTTNYSQTDKNNMNKYLYDSTLSDSARQGLRESINNLECPNSFSTVTKNSREFSYLCFFD